jgi:hypothetical protein
MNISRKKVIADQKNSFQYIQNFRTHPTQIKSGLKISVYKDALKSVKGIPPIPFKLKPINIFHHWIFSAFWSLRLHARI